MGPFVQAPALYWKISQVVLPVRDMDKITSLITSILRCGFHGFVKKDGKVMGNICEIITVFRREEEGL